MSQDETRQLLDENDPLPKLVPGSRAIGDKPGSMAEGASDPQGGRQAE